MAIPILKTSLNNVGTNKIWIYCADRNKQPLKNK